MRSLTLALLLTLATGAPATATPARPADPPCPPATASGWSIVARDLDEPDGGDLTATHSISVGIEHLDGRTVDDVSLDLPSGVVKRRGRPEFRIDTPGLVPVTARWSEFAGDTTCTASVSANLDITPATPPRVRFLAPGRSSNGFMGWQIDMGRPDIDLRPIEVRLRGVARARSPRGSDPVATMTLGLRWGERPFVDGAASSRWLASAGWRFRFEPLYDDQIEFSLVNPKTRRPSFGIDAQVLQGGVLVHRTIRFARCRLMFGTPVCRKLRSPRG